MVIRGLQQNLGSTRHFLDLLHISGDLRPFFLDLLHNSSALQHISDDLRQILGCLQHFLEK
jgi:hypothetical protein